LLGVLSVCTASPRGLPAQEGIINFGKVNEVLYRGAHLDAASLKNLQRLGIKTIINLHLPEEGWKAEAAEAAANGLVHTNIPLRGLGRPTKEQVIALAGGRSAWSSQSSGPLQKGRPRA